MILALTGSTSAAKWLTKSSSGSQANPSEPLKMRVHEHLPDAATIQPVCVEPVNVSMKTGTVAIGDD
jgi:hypothetical protein